MVTESGVNTSSSGGPVVNEDGASQAQHPKHATSHVSSEGERVMLETLDESTQGGRRVIPQFITMLSVIALPVTAVICLVSYTVHNSRMERSSQQSAVQQFQIFADIETLVTSVRAERGYTTSVVLLGGEDAAANEVMFKQRSNTDYVLLSLPVWPDRLTINNVQLTTRAHLGDMLNELRGQVSTMSVNVQNVLDFYSDITQQFMYWLLVISRTLRNLLP